MFNFSLGDGADTVVFGASKAANGEDTITNFTAGASGDVLNVKAFLSTVTAAKSATSLGTNGSGLSIANLDVSSGSENVLFINDQATLATSNFSTSGSGATLIKIKDNASYVVIAKDTSVDNIYYVTAASGSITVDQVGTVASSSGVITEFDATNFA